MGDLHDKLEATLRKIRTQQKLNFMRHLIQFLTLKLIGLFNKSGLVKINPDTATCPIKTSQLPAFIKHCQQLPAQPIPLHSPEKVIAVSIIIPVFNQWQLTSACINSILQTCDDSITWELILADDCSSDATVNAVWAYPGLIISKTTQNMGFLKNCNHAAKIARGRYIVLLNNDTIVLPNWLLALYKTAEEDKSIALVGSKMLRRDGSIHEAGCILFADGRSTHVGAGYARDTPIFNIARDIDYASGGSILIRKSFWNEVGGFDERYYHAYYEDADLAMTAHALQQRVVYQPRSEVIHFQGKSYNARKERHCKHLAKKNRPLFLTKWSRELRIKN